MAAWSIAGSLSLVAFAGILFFGFLTRRLHNLSDQMETFQQGIITDDGRCVLTGQTAIISHRGDETAQNKGVRLETRFSPDLPFVRADIGLVERALENLIENALRHTPSGGAITLSPSLQGERMKVEVADTGTGISPEHLPHIFDRTYRVPVENAIETADQTQGAGLGLAITKRIVELHVESLASEVL